MQHRLDFLTMGPPKKGTKAYVKYLRNQKLRRVQDRAKRARDKAVDMKAKQQAAIEKAVQLRTRTLSQNLEEETQKKNQYMRLECQWRGQARTLIKQRMHCTVTYRFNAACRDLLLLCISYSCDKDALLTGEGAQT